MAGLTPPPLSLPAATPSSSTSLTGSGVPSRFFKNSRYLWEVWESDFGRGGAPSKQVVDRVVKVLPGEYALTSGHQRRGLRL